MMKVLFLSAWYPNRNDVMSGLFVRKHAEAVSIFADVAVLYIIVDKNIDKIDVTVNKTNKIYELIVYFPTSSKSAFRRLYIFINFIRAYFRGFKILHKNWGKPDIIQANVFTRTAAVAFVYKLIYKVPYVVIEHWTRYFRGVTFRNVFHKLISRLVARNASAIMPVTEHLKNCMIKHGMKNFNYVVVNNVVDNVFFNKMPAQQSEKKVILNVTCFDDEQKNLSGLLNVIGEVYKIRQDFIVYMVGIGNDFEKIKNKANEMGIENKAIVFKGLLQGEELAKTFYQSDFSVLFSNYENIPVVISESLVCGKPVISTNVGGISEHVNDSNGILIPAGDENALIQNIDYMLDHFQEFNSEEIKAVARQKFSMESIGNLLYEQYKQCVK
ncbi:MAG: glycosyltransferase family 4 protein [Paludibacter sp.]